MMAARACMFSLSFMQRLLFLFFGAIALAACQEPRLANLVFTRPAERELWPALRASTQRFFGTAARHYVCIDQPAERAGDWAGWTVLPPVAGLAEPNASSVQQDALMLDCARRVREPAVLVMIGDWLLRRPVDGAAPASAEITSAWDYV